MGICGTTQQPGETKVFLMENASTKIYDHVEKEICGETVDGVEDTFTVTTAPVNVTGLSANAEVQYYDTADDVYFRKDVLVFYRKSGVDTVVDTTANPITVTTTDLIFTTAPTASEADSVVVSYCHTPSDRSDEIVSLTPGGGGRPVEYVTVQGGEKVRIEKAMEAKSISFEVLSLDGGFVEYINGNEVSETSGSDIIRGSVGSQRRCRKAIVVTVDDPETGNKRVECFFNVVGVSNEGSAPSEGHWAETVGFECPPQDYCRITLLNDQA